MTLAICLKLDQEMQTSKSLYEPTPYSICPKAHTDISSETRGLASSQSLCTNPGSFVREGPTLTSFFSFLFFLVDEGREDPNTTKSGPLSAHQRNAF